MRIEIGEKIPEGFKEDWPGQYEIFSHIEFTSGIPSALFMITTLKENGEPNACLHAWSSFAGDSGGFFAVMPGLLKSTHTYKNILRDREFCINFLSPEYYESCLKTIEQNDEAVDELSVGGFTAEPARMVKPPRIKEAFLTYECKLESDIDLSGKGISAMITGRVVNAAVDEKHCDLDRICSGDGFMLNVHCPKNPKTGEGTQSAVARLEIVSRG